ncbi:hypothetical protein BMB171_C1381 [Bacillus thuringiensis BMB171]|nr:hypothetical protein BMB171_C1381 [Bacillus thuringiensis BMB171]
MLCNRTTTLGTETTSDIFHNCFCSSFKINSIMIIETRILSCKECIFNYFWNLIISNVCSFFSTVFIEEIPVFIKKLC